MSTPTPQHQPGEPSASLRVRSYVLTGGRTRIAADLPFEALVTLTDRGRAETERLTLERAAIARKAADTPSVAELGAHLDLPVGVVRVLVADMVAEGLLTTTSTHHSLDGSRPDRTLLERVFDGLQAL